jgi:ABC-type branched-subunit amino acid transport system substrate-binding protein
MSQEIGASDSIIRLGSVMDLQGDSSGIGQGMRLGLEMAFRDQKIRGRSLDLVIMNDSYNPQTAIDATKELVRHGLFAMIGNVGTPTARVVLPILAENKIPAVGFFTGASILRPGIGDVINFRASYIQEVATIIGAVFDAGISTDEICAYVQNDSYGMAGILGIQMAIANRPDTKFLVEIFDKIINMEGPNPPRNNIGPVGVYVRNTLKAKDGYDSLKHWEKSYGSNCRIVVTVGTYIPVANFAGYSRYKGENWLISAVSFTGAENLKAFLEENGIANKVIMTQVVPDLKSPLPIVAQARAAIGEQLNYVSLEGFIVGKMFLKIMEKNEGDISRANFLKTVRGQMFNLDGLILDFTDDNQGSDMVLMTYLKDGHYVVINSDDLRSLFQE